MSDHADRLKGPDLGAQVAKLEDQLARYQAVDAVINAEVAVPKFTKRRRRKADHHATACALLSDLHLDEVVNPSELGGANAYDRRIAEMRLDRFFDSVPWLAQHYLTNVIFDGFTLFVGGDIISGDIHEELTETNEGTTLETCIEWAPRIASGIAHLADEFGAVHVPWIVGNHGRRTRRPRSKGRARDNFDWLIGRMCQQSLRDDDRITWDIPDAIETITPIYDTSFLLYHGEARGGNGIGGIWPPLMRLRSKKLDRYRTVDRHFDVMCVGHWHQYVHAPGMGLIVNGSLKGYDEYAATEGFGAEAPQQAFWLVTPERGVTFSAPVLALDREAEGW